MGLKLKHLVFGGCGVRNAAYAGALLALEERGLYSSVTHFAGTSAGSIVASLCAVGYSPEEVRQAILDLDFAKLTDARWYSGPFNLLRRMGWNRADYLVTELNRLLGDKLGVKNPSFRDLHEKTGNRLSVVSTNLSLLSPRIFPDENSMDLTLAQAVRMSVSIPFFFTAVNYQNSTYVDGGVVWNLPLEIFDKAEESENTLAFLVRAKNEPSHQEVDSVHEVGPAVLKSMLRAQDIELDIDPSITRRTVFLDDLGIDTTHFQITAAQKKSLIASGKELTQAWLNKRLEGEDLS